MTAIADDNIHGNSNGIEHRFIVADVHDYIAATEASPASCKFTTRSEHETLPAALAACEANGNGFVIYQNSSSITLFSAPTFNPVHLAHLGLVV